jgi:hypothetical protein
VLKCCAWHILIIADINAKQAELDEVNKAYTLAELNDETDKANTLFTRARMLEMQIEQLQCRKRLLADAKGGNSAILKELAEKVKQENIEEMQKQATLKRQYKQEIPTIEQEYRNKLKEIGTKCNECESTMLVLAQEIGEVIDYIDSFTVNENNSIKKLGTHTILSMAKVSL